MSHILDILGFYYRMPPMLNIDSEISGLFQKFWSFKGHFGSFGGHFDMTQTSYVLDGWTSKE